MCWGQGSNAQQVGGGEARGSGVPPAGCDFTVALGMPRPPHEGSAQGRRGSDLRMDAPSAFPSTPPQPSPKSSRLARPLVPGCSVGGRVAEPRGAMRTRPGRKMFLILTGPEGSPKCHKGPRGGSGVVGRQGTGVRGELRCSRERWAGGQLRAGWLGQLWWAPSSRGGLKLPGAWTWVIKAEGVLWLWVACGPLAVCLWAGDVSLQPEFFFF